MSIYEETTGQLNLTEQHIYGSSRLGMRTLRTDMLTAPTPLHTGVKEIIRGERRYELTNHLGNVLVVCSDQITATDGDANNQIDFYATEVVSYSDYYPFGAEMTARSSSGDYRYNFQNQEKDDEFWGGAITFKYRIEDGRLGRFFSVDPLVADFPYNSPYAFSENSVINSLELEGLEKIALSGSVPEAEMGKGNQYKSHENIETFLAQGKRLEVLYGFHSSQVQTGAEIYNALKKESIEHGPISFLALFGHSDPRGFYMRDQMGLYSDGVVADVSSGQVSARDVYDLKWGVESGEIQFECDAVIFINGCNTANSTMNYVLGSSNSTIAESLSKNLGVTVIAATGSMEMVDPNNPNGQWRITNEPGSIPGEFVKITPVWSYIVERKLNPKYEKWNPFNKEPKYINETRIEVSTQTESLGTTISIDDYVKE